MKSIFTIVALLSALLAAGPAAAQASYPEQAIRILVGFPPGGPPDIAARLLGEKFAEAWGRAVVSRTRPAAAATSRSSA